MASWCCPHVSSGEVQPSVYVPTSYGRMAARCPTASSARPAVHELLPAKCQNGRRGVARAALFLFTEVCPFALALDSGFLRLVDADAVTTAPTHVYGTAPAAPRGESSGQFV